MDVVDGDAVRRLILNQLEKRVVALDVEDVVEHGVDQCLFARSGGAHQQNGLVLTMAGMTRVAESKSIDFSSRFVGLSERHNVKVQPAMDIDLLASTPNIFD